MSCQFGRFTIETAPLGVGQSASVYKAVDSEGDGVWALKIFNHETANDAVLLRRFDREVKVLKKLRHPGVVKIHDHGIHDDQPWIAMQYCEAKSLKDNGDFREKTVGRKMRGLARVASAIDFCHANGVIHRDLKPSNILLDENGDLYLTDFGIAKTLNETTKITLTGSVLGTAAYMSPEQAQDQKIGPASDIYALGVIAYEMILGDLPFIGSSVPAVMLKHITEPVPIPSGTNPIIATALRRALAKDPGQRWNSATDLVAILNEALMDAMSDQLDQTVEITKVARDPQRKPRVLVVDSSQERVEAIRFRLKYNGITPVVAKSGPEGMQKLQGGAFDVIILQTDLEWVTGMDLARQVRASEKRYGNRALIIGTADDPGGDCLKESLQSGIDQVVKRPMEREFLESILVSMRGKD